MTNKQNAPPPGAVVWLDQGISADADAAADREWWLTNGIGGYAGGTVAGILARRYHGLLIASLHPPLGRFLLFAKADAVLIDGSAEIPLHTNHWGVDVVEPRGYRFIEQFFLDGALPVWHYTVEGLGIEHRIWMDHGANRTHVAYRWAGGERADAPHIRLGLMASFRDHHSVNRPHSFQIATEVLADGLRLHLPRDLAARDPPVVERFVDVRSRHGAFSTDETWIENFFLARERERGLEDSDHHLRVGHVELPLTNSDWRGITIGLGATEAADLQASLSIRRKRTEELQREALPGVDGEITPPWIRQLVTAADAYVFRRRESDERGKASVIAGYPWFGDWGRDTMIAIPGLTLATGRPQIAREILETFAGYVSDGMLPNVLPLRGEAAEYNTVDAALWFIEAWRAYYAFTDDSLTLNAVFPALDAIVDAYRNGTRFGIEMDARDGLIRAGVPGQQLTWMDARVDGREVTPRHGKPVEINALWYNALQSMAFFAQAMDKDPSEFQALAGKAAASFSRYHRGDNAGLYDVLDGPNGPAADIRPNQIFAVSLPFSPLSDRLQQAVVEECEAHLLTPFGLRSLSPVDARYSGTYFGGVRERDGTYHQGPVWGWLLGHYALAEYRVSGDAFAAQRRLEPMADHLAEAGLGQISEIFDGDPPHAPRGAPAQAWSVACTLEAWWRLALETAKVNKTS